MPSPNRANDPPPESRWRGTEGGELRKSQPTRADAEDQALEATSTATADTGNTFRYDPTSSQYIFNLATKPLSTGTWQLFIDLGDGSGWRTYPDVPRISLKK